MIFIDLDRHDHLWLGHEPVAGRDGSPGVSGPRACPEGVRGTGGNDLEGLRAACPAPGGAIQKAIYFKKTYYLFSLGAPASDLETSVQIPTSCRLTENYELMKTNSSYRTTGTAIS